MSQGPSRGFPSHNYSTIPQTSLPRQPVMNNQQSFQQTIMTSSPPTTIGNSSASPNTRTMSTPNSAQQDKIFCDSCQTFRHVAYFGEKDFKYNVCNLCHTREMQKRKHQMERYDAFDDQQQRNYKQARYQGIQYPATQQQLHTNAPITLNSRSNNSPLPPPPPPPSSSSSQSTPPQVKQSPPIIHGLKNTTTNFSNNKQHIFTPPNSTATMRNQSQLMHPQSVLQNSISLPLPNQQSPHDIPVNTTNDTPNGNLVLPSSAMTTTLTPITTHHKMSASAERASQDIISLDQFVKELEKEIEFDRKPYHLDIGPLMESMGENPGFTQLGRGICERVLEGTKFNFRQVTAFRIQKCMLIFMLI